MPACCCSQPRNEHRRTDRDHSGAGLPTAGLIYGVSGVRDGYLTGRGRVVMRARTHIEDLPRNGRQAIVVDELPYQVNKKTLQEKIAELVHEKKIDGIAHIQDESDKSGMRLVIELKKGEVPRWC
jgi:DNA gyrase subunit A